MYMSRVEETNTPSEDGIEWERCLQDDVYVGMLQRSVSWTRRQEYLNLMVKLGVRRVEGMTLRTWCE